MTSEERAVDLFQNGYYCAESVLLALAGIASPGKEIDASIATGFCSGLSRTGGTCGAVSGAIMAISLKFGRKRPGDKIDENYEKVRIFLSEFAEKFGSINCAELLGCHLGTEEGQTRFLEQNLKEKKCNVFVREATGMGQKMLEIRTTSDSSGEKEI